MSINSFYSKLLHRKTKTFWVGLFCLAVLVYLCLLARVNIQQFKSNFVQQTQQQLLQQARAEGKHIEDAITIFNLKLQNISRQIIDSGNPVTESDPKILHQQFSLNPKSLYLIDDDGAVQSILCSKDSAGDKSIQGLIDEMSHYSYPPNSNCRVRIHEKSNTLNFVSRIQNLSDFQGYAFLSVSLSDFLRSIDTTMAFSGYNICLVGSTSNPICLKKNGLTSLLESQKISQDENHPYNRVLSKMRRGQEGVSKLSKDIFINTDVQSSDTGEILIGYSPLNVTDQRWSVAVISDDLIIDQAVHAHAQGIMVAMICLFAVLLIVCFVYYKSEKRALLLQQQSELGQTTKELHQVTVEKRQIVEKLQNKVRFYRQLLDALPIPIYWRDRDGVLKSQNSSFKKMVDAGQDSDGSKSFISRHTQIDNEVLAKGIELLNVPETIDFAGHPQQYLVSRIPVRPPNHSDKNGMVSCYLSENLFKNLFQDRPCGLLKHSCLTQELSLPIAFIDSEFIVQRANPAFYDLVERDSEQNKTFGLAQSLKIDSNHSILESISNIWKDQQEGIRQFQLKCHNKEYQIFVQPILSDYQGAILLLKDQSQDAESGEMIEFELFRCRSELNEQEIKIQKYESCLPERLERLFRDKVKRAEEILAMKDEDPMSTFQIQQLIESVRKSLNCSHKQNNNSQMEFHLSAQLPNQIFSQWHKLYQSLLILSETLSTQASGAVRFCVQKTSESEWLDETSKNTEGLVFSVEYDGSPLLEGFLPLVLDVEMPLTQWYNQCQQRDQAINLRVVARLLSKIDYRLMSSSDDGVSRFWFILPITAKETIADTLENDSKQKADHLEMSANQAEQSDVPHILIVDDVEENRTLMQIILAKDGHRTTICQDGEKAVQLCDEERFDLILMDIQMPGMNGLEATRKIREDGMNTSTPIIAMTASDQQEDELAALDCGCDDYLTKPIKRKLMERKIWRSLEKTRQIKDAEAGKDIISFLDGDGDYQKAIEAFVDNLPHRVEEMKLAFQQHDMKDLAFKVHALKGLGGFAGFSVYTEKARQMEESIKGNDIDKINAQLDEMIQMCMRTRLKSEK